MGKIREGASKQSCCNFFAVSMLISKVSSYFFPEGFFEEALAPVKKGSMGPPGFSAWERYKKGRASEAAIAPFCFEPGIASTPSWNPRPS
ncbi:MAG: hypothetical protein DRP03_03170 [Candidatus Aenigmatarchaeota archaeon]|nr:MAG: hypothetical protein DRP03_03170 [Candidatus Aenigmarchaeota archaeon]